MRRIVVCNQLLVNILIANIKIHCFDSLTLAITILHSAFRNFDELLTFYFVIGYIYFASFVFSNVYGESRDRNSKVSEFG